MNYGLVRVKRAWVPEWLWSACKPFVLWLWPLQEILTGEPQPEPDHSRRRENP